MSYTEAVEAIRDVGKKVYVIATGAGAGIQKILWDVPGVSSTLVGTSFPYATEETDEVLGFKPEKYCSVETAVDLAQAAYLKAWSKDADAIGVGLTASVASTREHRGDHRVHIALFSARRCRTISATIEKGVGLERRRMDGDICDQLALHALGYEATGKHLLTQYIQDAMRTRGLLEFKDEPNDELAKERFFARPFFHADGTRSEGPIYEGVTLYPGAFNPPHEGHFGISRKIHDLRPIFEVTSDAPHKPALAVAEMLQRAKLLRGHDRLFTRGCPFFLDKAKQYPKCNLVLGIDAFIRVFDKQWCSNPNELAAQFSAAKTHFWVFGRTVNGSFLTLQEATAIGLLPMRIRATPVDGRWDVSSSALREVSHEVRA